MIYADELFKTKEHSLNIWKQGFKREKLIYAKDNKHMEYITRKGN